MSPALRHHTDRLGVVAVLSLGLLLSTGCAGKGKVSQDVGSSHSHPAPTQSEGGAAARAEPRVSGQDALRGPTPRQVYRTKRFGGRSTPVVDGERALLNPAHQPVYPKRVKDC